MSDDVELDRPPLTITLSTGEKVKMTYGLEMDLRRMLPDPAGALNLALNDPFTQDYVVRRCLTKRSAMITDSADLVTEVDADLSPDDTENLIMWAVEHVLYFFAKRSTAMARLATKFQAGLPNQLQSGSATSASTMPSAGPSE